MKTQNILLELRKRKDETIITISQQDLENNSDKILLILKKECVDLKSWFYIIIYYFSKQDYLNFKKFSDELSKLDVELNPFYKDQKQTFIYILNIFSFYYNYLSQKCKEKEKCDNYTTLSTSYVNQAETFSMYNPMTMICKGFLFFVQGDYDNSETYFANIDEDKHSDLNKYILILAKIGRALNLYNKSNYSKAADYFISLIRDYDFINENILESLAICYYNLGKIKKAKEIFKKILQINNNNYKALTYLAIIDLSEITKNPNSLENTFNKLKSAYLMDTESEFHFLLITISNIFLICGKVNEAEDICNKLNAFLDYGEMKFIKKQTKEKNRKDLDDLKSAIYCVNAKIHHLKKNYSEAFTWYNRAVSSNSKNIEAQFGLGQIYLSMHNLADAEKCFEACKVDYETSNSFEINKYLAFIYARTKKKQLETTIEIFKKAIELKKDDTDCYIELAQLLEFKKPEESLKLYEAALRIHDENNNKENNNLYNIDEIKPELLNNIAAIKIRLGLENDVDKITNQALSLIKKKLVGIKDENEIIHLNSLELNLNFNLAIYHENKNELGEAYSIYKMLINKNPYFIDAYVKLGELARQRGNKNKALEYMKLAIEKHFMKQNNVQMLIPIMVKPITPMLLIAHIHVETGNDNEAHEVLNNIIKHYDNKDIYTLVFLGNIFYELATQIRVKQSEYNIRLGRALEYYMQALENDKYNCYAANGIANILAEFNMLNNSLDTYKNINEKQPNNYNSYINESLIYINDQKYEKASIILNKILKKQMKNKNEEIENLLAKTYMEMKDYERAIKILKNLMFRYPDNLYYSFNYALCLRAKAEEILVKNERRVKETEEAIDNLEKSIPIFESYYHMRREINANLKGEKDEKFFKHSEFFYKCNDLMEISKLSLSEARNMLDSDRVRENDLIQKIEENRLRFRQLLDNQKELDEKQKEELRRKMEENEALAESLKQKVEIIAQKKEELTVKKKPQKEEVPEKEDSLNDSGTESKKKKKQKKRKLKKKIEDEDNNAYIDPEEHIENKKRKLKHSYLNEDLSDSPIVENDRTINNEDEI